MKTQEEVAPLNMQVPERILVAGGNSHVAAKNLPRELQLESSVLSPSPEQVSHHCYIKIPRLLFRKLALDDYSEHFLILDPCIYTSKVNTARGPFVSDG